MKEYQVKHPVTKEQITIRANAWHEVVQQLKALNNAG
jgi:hypothetical protein